MFLSRTDSSNRRIYGVLIGKLYLKHKKPEIRYFNANYFKTKTILYNCNFLTCHRAQWHRTDMTNACPVVVIPQRPRALAEIKWEPGQLPEDLTLTTSPNPLPPMAGKGTEGRRETAEKTRHTRAQPLNTDVTVKALCALSSSDIYAWLPLESVQLVHTPGRNAHIYTVAKTDVGVRTWVP